MTAKHTPGPWRVERRSARKDSNYGGYAKRVEAEGQIRAICKVYGGEEDEREVAEANALVIAAAPDLLAAVYAVGSDPTFRTSCAQHLIDAIDAAYAKAEGK